MVTALGVPRRMSSLVSRKTAGRASAAVASRATQSVVSFVLQILASANIGADGYGRFAILLGILSTLTALQSGFRDSAIVLGPDRASPGVVLLGQYGAVAAAVSVAFGITAVSGLLPARDALLFALMIGVWNIEEMGVRYLTRDRRFVAVWVNNLFYGVGAIGFIGVGLLSGAEPTVASFLWAMIVGASLAIVVGVVQLPARTLSPFRVARRGFSEILRFACWRSAQKVVEPLGLTLARVAVATLTSAAVLGQVEAARLLTQPIWILVGGLAPVLLTAFVHRDVEGKRTSVLDMRLIGLGMAGLCVIGGALAVVFTPALQSLLGDGAIQLDRLAVAGWSVFYVTAAYALPSQQMLVGRRDSFGVFVILVAGMSLGVAFAGLVTVVLSAIVAPLGLAVGRAVATVSMTKRAAASDPGPHD